MKKFLSVLLSILIICICTSCEKNIYNNDEKYNQEKNKYQIIATWINYYEINNIVKASDSQIMFEDNVSFIIKSLKKYKINTIFLQVRAFDDSFYKSELCPVSSYCSNNDNKLKFDVLETFIHICKDNYIDVHAWINPYRIRNDNKINEISKNYYASQIIKNNINDERIIITNNNIYYNPAYIENQNYILNCVREIITNYDVKGIHIDDYFYSTTSTDIDKIIFNEYQKSGGKLSLTDYRRNCINILISSLYRLVSIQNNLIFSISPCGDIDKNYNELYADVELWTKNDGYADYIIPQLYYGFENETLSFKKAFDNWANLNNKSNKIIIGLPLYKIGNVDTYAGNGKGEWMKNSNVIINQIKYSEKNNIAGFAFYSSSYLYDNSSNAKLESDKKEILSYINEKW